jgi:transcriptional regulator with XRE-family HTH domain
MTMAQVIDPKRLQQLRKLRGLTQDELAKKARLNKQTVYRLENEKGKAAVPRKGTLDRLPRALDFDLGVLTGEKPIPSDASQPSASEDGAAYQLNVRVDAAVRNAFELVARRYRISVPKIAQLAPLLFVIIAEHSLKRRRKNLEDLRDELKERLYGFENIRDELHKKFPHIPFPNIDWDDQDEAMKTEEESIKSRDLFGEKRIVDDSRGEAFADCLKALTAGDDDITIDALGPTSTEYRVCHSVATELAGGDRNLAEWLLNGEVPLHRMPKREEHPIEWMRQNKIAVHKLPEDVIERFPEEREFNVADIRDLDLDSI